MNKQNKTSDDANFAAILNYRAFRTFVLSITWLIFGLLFGELISPLSTVGYLGCLYYLFVTLTILTPIKASGSKDLIAQNILNIKNELKSHPELNEYQSELDEQD